MLVAPPAATKGLIHLRRYKKVTKHRRKSDQASEKVTKRFPNDRRVQVIQPDLSIKMAWESENLMHVHKWSEQEILDLQARRKERCL